MPLTLCRSGLSPSAPSGPHAGYHSSTPAIDPWLVPPQTAPALLPSPLAAANSQRPVDHRALDPHRNPPSRPLPPAFGLRLAPLWCRPLSPASASPLSPESGLRLAPTCRVFRSGCCPCGPHPSGAFRDRSRGSRLSPGPSGLAFRLGPPAPGLRPAPLVRPSSLPSRLPSACASGFRSGSAAGSIGLLNSRLAPAVPASRALSNPTDDLLRGHRLLRTLGLPNLCTQVQNQRILWIT